MFWKVVLFIIKLLLYIIAILALAWCFQVIGGDMANIIAIKFDDLKHIFGYSGGTDVIFNTLKFLFIAILYILFGKNIFNLGDLLSDNKTLITVFHQITIPQILMIIILSCGLWRISYKVRDNLIIIANIPKPF